MVLYKPIQDSHFEANCVYFLTLESTISSYEQWVCTKSIILKGEGTWTDLQFFININSAASKVWVATCLLSHDKFSITKLSGASVRDGVQDVAIT